MKIVLDTGAKMPTRAHKDDAGLDLYLPTSCDKAVVPARDSIMINTGVHVEIPKGYAGFIKSKSGLNCKQGIVTEGVIDTGYTGAIQVKLYNHSKHDYTIYAGEKITQLVIVKTAAPEIELADSLDATERGDNGFGSTGA